MIMCWIQQGGGGTLGLGANHLFDGVARQGVEKHGEEKREEKDENDLEDCPLVVMPDYVSN
jgi:hypothetical protein